MNNRKLVTIALFITTALMLSYIESLFPFFFGVPGMKLGLANLAVVMALYFYGWKEAVLVNVLRIVLSGVSLLFSLGGALISFVCMVFVRKMGLSLYGVSMAGAVFHNVGQLLIAVLLVQTVEVGYYAPFLLAAGLVTGFLIGALGKELLRRIPGGQDVDRG